MENRVQIYQRCGIPAGIVKRRVTNAMGSISNITVIKLLDTTLLVFAFLIVALLPSGCDSLETNEVFKPKTRTAQFTIAPTLGQIKVTRPDNPEVSSTSYYMIATEDGTVESIKIFSISGFTYEEGYVYRVKMTVISEPVVGDMVLTGQRKSDWDNVEYSDKNYELIEVLSKTKVND